MHEERAVGDSILTVRTTMVRKRSKSSRGHRELALTDVVRKRDAIAAVLVASHNGSGCQGSHLLFSGRRVGVEANVSRFTHTARR